MLTEKNNKISIIIPNYNGKELLEKNLSNIISTAEMNKINYEIIVVDDKSTDDSIVFLKDNYKTIKVVKNSKNSGFGISCNNGAKASTGNLIMFLNNDVVLERNFFNKIVYNFSDGTVFSVVPRILITGDKYINESITGGYFKGGMVNFITLSTLKNDINFKEKIEILWACGAACIVDRSKFFEIGGFDEIFSPGYIEDVDLSYNALKRGWKIIYEPDAVAYHDKSSTIELLYNKEGIDLFYKQHVYFFIWKNITYLPWVISHLFYLLAKHLLMDINEVRIIWRSLKRLKELIKKRKALKETQINNDKEIFSKFNSLNNLLAQE